MPDLQVVTQCATRNKIVVSVSNIRDRQRLDVRHYFEEGGQLHPTKKGLSIPLESAADLLDGLLQAQEPANNTEHLVRLDIDVREPVHVKVAPYRNAMRLDVRHYYEADGAFLPGGKGVNLMWADRQQLIQSLRELLGEVESA